MADMKWKDAIEKILEEERKALHYTEIAELVAERGYRTSLGATPQDTVNAQINTDINSKEEKSIFAKTDRGYFILRKFLDSQPDLLPKEPTEKEKAEKFRIIGAFGIYWNRNLVHWKSIPDLLGIQQIGASEVNFKDQIGIYLLHDNRETIYVGQAIDQTLGQRLKHHTMDRLSGRWNRFSWFGLYPVSNEGKLQGNIKFEGVTIQDLGNILEAVLIESIEPRQNRKQGNLFSGIEYLQREAPEILKKKKEDLIRELTDKL